MIEVAIMIEGQNGLTWERWQRIARAVEELGFVGLYRSDHYTNANPPDKESLELWTSLTWLASHTEIIEFGPLVSPVSFRHPTITARMAAAVDDLSSNRLTLGMGAGWQEREHNNFGWDLLELPERFNRFEEGLEVVTKLLQSEEPVNFKGKYYDLNDAILLPRPIRPGGPPILIGGNGKTRTLPLAAKYANEWNGLFVNPGEYKKLNTHLDKLLEEQDREPESVKRSLMTGCVFGQNEGEVNSIIEDTYQGKSSKEDLKKRGVIVGTANQFVDHLGKLSEAGVQRVMLQWLDLDDIERLEVMATAVLPQVHE